MMEKKMMWHYGYGLLGLGEKNDLFCLRERSWFGLE